MSGMKKNHIIRIDSDGMPNDTRISMDEGQDLDHVVAATWRLRTGEYATVDLEVYGVAAHTEGILDSCDLVCPVCRTTVSHSCND
jgi:hypothetical protein